MIHVPRPEALAVLSGAASPGGLERHKVLKHYRGRATKRTPFNGYAAYKLPAVKTTLMMAFRNKCGYCEMDYGGAPLDVEHFRPKSAVVELDLATLKPRAQARVDKPGYFWLAAEWTNLLVSCIDCNRPRKQPFADEVDEVTGKSNYFPVAGGVRCLDPTKDCEATEQRLLLDPCRDFPEEHLEFGLGGTIRPKEGAGGADPKGEASIAVYGLQRIPLVRKREEHLIKLRFYLEQLIRVRGELSKAPTDQRLRREWAEMLAGVRTNFLAPDKPFLSMCRQVVRETIGDLIRPGR